MKRKRVLFQPCAGDNRQMGPDAKGYITSYQFNVYCSLNVDGGAKTRAKALES